ncbi:serine/threonine-protein kinase [Alienimonas californiensis]|uniref:Serine/threonine-protein kinase PknB n=1 Tax=Alienimonas californiensis TaxID=2527989 RepID=A0A517PFK6_9PLAN|nr:serine/threonine-protein kinase [Alienimonas californiensis]QDT18149.1 Serine/threonine-protein kinase PknB [Alienimonas californiensis]
MTPSPPTAASDDAPTAAFEPVRPITLLAGDDDREERLDAVLAELLDDPNSAARAAAYERHPDLADDLRSFFSGHDRLRDAAGPPVGDADQCPPPRFGNYELVRELDRGGMGVVWEARQLAPPRPCAVKVLRAGPDELTAADLARFRTEGAASAALCHPHIVRVYEAGVLPADAGAPGSRPRAFLSMELVAGPNLSNYAAGSPLPPREAAAILADVADAVSHAHARGVLHRDLKPANVLLDLAAERSSSGYGRPGNDEPDARGAPVAKVADFGLAKRFGPTAVDGSGEAVTVDSGQTRTGQIVGTPGYMAPEQAVGHDRGGVAVGVAADVYGLGAILYHLLTGRVPFTDEGDGPMGVLRRVLDADPLPPRSLNPRAARELEAVALKCLRKDPRSRYGGAAEVAAEMRRFLAGEPVQAAGGGAGGLAYRVAGALTASRHEDHFRYWGRSLLAFAGVVAAAHVVIFFAERAGYGFLVAHLLPAGAMLLGLAAVLWCARRKGHGVLPTDSVERPIWAVWSGYLVARGMLTVMAWRQGWDSGVTYGVASLMAGAAFYTLGGHAWGVCYLIAAAFFSAALPLAAVGPWAVPAFGAMWTAVLLWLGLRYCRIDRQRREEAAGAGESLGL